MTATRRTFLTASAAAVAVPAAAAPVTAAMLRRIEGGLPESFPSQDAAAVRELVLHAHSKEDVVRKMVERRPELAKATIDWGFGDWESGLGAATHVGRRDIAEVLIAHGARPNLFTFAMFGQVDAVRAVCEANPGIQKILGPHGITLLQHARFGRDHATSVVEYLEELGDADIGEINKPIAKEVADAYIGEYEPRDASGVTFHIKWRERGNNLTFTRDDRQLRFLKYHGEHRFAPSGAPHVSVAFDDLVDDHARRLTIRDGGLEIICGRR